MLLKQQLIFNTLVEVIFENKKQFILKELQF